jgi:hypothetical protein
MAPVKHRVMPALYLSILSGIHCRQVPWLVYTGGIGVEERIVDTSLSPHLLRELMIMNKKLLVTLTCLVMLGFNISSQAATAVTVNYGVVDSVGTTTKDSKHAGGVLAGGLIGGLIGPRRHRGLRVIAGAGIGAAVQGSATSGVLQQYTVNLVSGGQSIISTEQTDIRTGDCVSIEQGDHANIRRVSSYHCETNNKKTAEHHQTGADNCQLAKNELTKAETDQAITNAAKKVRILCED